MQPERFVSLGGGRMAHASGALWIHEQSIAVVADIHLGYAWAMRRRRQLGPLSEGGVKEKLIETVQELQPDTLLLLGDVVHAPKPHAEERLLVEQTLREVASFVRRVIVIRGNHDRHFARDYGGLGIETVDRWESSEVVAIHGDKPMEKSDKHLVIGHIHPAIGVVDSAGASQRVPVF